MQKALVWAITRHDTHTTTIWIHKACMPCSTHKASMCLWDTHNKAQGLKISSFSQGKFVAVFGFVNRSLLLTQKTDSCIGLCEDKWVLIGSYSIQCYDPFFLPYLDFEIGGNMQI